MRISSALLDALANFNEVANTKYVAVISPKQRDIHFPDGQPLPDYVVVVDKVPTFSHTPQGVDCWFDELVRDTLAEDEPKTIWPDTLEGQMGIMETFRLVRTEPTPERKTLIPQQKPQPFWTKNWRRNK